MILVWSAPKVSNTAEEKEIDPAIGEENGDHSERTSSHAKVRLCGKRFHRITSLIKMWTNALKEFTTVTANSESVETLEDHLHVHVLLDSR